LLTSKNPGVATITAQVTIEGKTESGSFPVKVMPNLVAASIQVNEKAVKSFNPDNMQYSYLMKKPSSSAPVVMAIPADPDVHVEVAQANSVPGTASISVIDYITFDKKDYVINFGVPSLEDDFNGKELGNQWNWIRENTSNWTLTKKPGSMVLLSGEGDLIETNNNAQNVLLQSANTDWTIETKIVCSRRPSSFTENAGILAYQDDDYFVKLAYRPSFGRGSFRRAGSGEQPGSVELLVESGGEQLSSVQLSMADIIKDDNSLVLKLVKKGSQYIAYCSSDGQDFEKVGEATIILKDVLAGIIAIDGILSARFAGFRRFMQPGNQPQTPFEVAFDYFKIANSGLK